MALVVTRRSACMDQRPPERNAKRAREEEIHAAPEQPDFPFEEEEEEETAAGAGEASRRPPGVFQFPWQKCRGGLGVSAAGSSRELRDVFFRSLVDGGAAAIGVPGDRLVSPPPGRRALLEGVDAWLAAAADGEVDPVWRSALMARSSRMDGRGPSPRMLRPRVASSALRCPPSSAS
ncbi:hypothetical protein Zm00014a_003269 [Zea mays]|uniref:Uncharacterized protein n=1 Tax=Zea mays TaxID=4577 RepID=A0A3L6DV33_MAIZE|nr:hypothetical protein Zm00014a_003269 [Zea mays]